MTLPTSGPISLGLVNAELGVGLELPVNLDSAPVRALFAKPSGPIALSDGYGKSAGPARVSTTITVGTVQNYVANISKVSGYVAGSTDATFVLSGAISSASTGSFAFTVDDSWNAGDTVTVQMSDGSSIMSKGGSGGVGGNSSGGVPSPGQPGLSGGSAVRVMRPVTWINSGTGSVVAGSGGGGGGSPAFANFVFKGVTDTSTYSGGGGGGGAGFGIGGSPGVASGGNNGNFYGGGGSNGTATSGGAPGGGGTDGSGGYAAPGGAGGSNAGSGSPGSSQVTDLNWFGTAAPGAGGPPGAALVGLSFVNSGAGIPGTVTGAQV